MKRAVTITLALCLLAVTFALPLSAEQPTWQEQYWEVFWEHIGLEGGDNLQVNLLDLNNNGVLDLVITGYYSSGVFGTKLAATIANGESRVFHGGGSGNAYRHLATNQLWHLSYADGSVSAGTIGWSLPDEFAWSTFAITRGDAYFIDCFDIGDEVRVSREEFDRFVANFVEGWERIEGLGLSLPGIDVFEDATDYESVRARFFAAMDELSEDGTLDVEPIPGLVLSTGRAPRNPFTPTPYVPAEPGVPPEVDIPQTGDAFGASRLLAAFFIAAGGAITLLYLKKRKTEVSQ